MPKNVHQLAETSATQLGNVTRAQARTAGLTNDQVRRKVRAGELEPAGTHVLRSPFLGRNELGDVMALVLDCGDGAVVSGPTAAALHGFDGFRLLPPFHVTIPRGRFVDRAPHIIHTTIALGPEDRTLRHSVPVMTPARSLVDLAKSARPKVLTVALDSALRDRLLTEEQLHRRIVELRSQGRFGIPTLLNVIDGSEASRGGHIWLERRFLEICARAALPHPITQQVVTSTRNRLVRVDFRFPNTPVIVEVLGYHWHRGSRAQLSRDAERLNALVRQGLLPLQFTYDHVTLDEAWVIAEVRATLRVV